MQQEKCSLRKMFRRNVCSERWTKAMHKYRISSKGHKQTIHKNNVSPKKFYDHLKSIRLFETINVRQPLTG